ncbi:MAG: hypothetical protein NTY38_13790 [Acidobacteria bacterium]|nr:hypothetical protein [Acidobacteriota bacterium]
MKRLCLLAPTAALFCLFLTGCAMHTSVARVLNDPYHFRNREVHLRGTVTGSVNALIAGGYRLDDGTGKIAVISNGAPPRKGAEVSVTGRVTEGASILGQGIGVMVRERDRRYHGSHRGPRP